MRILIAEDERELRSIICKRLADEGYAVDSVDNGSDAADYLESGTYDAAILDIMMPGKDGLEVLKEYREGGGHTPIMLLTARDSVSDRVLGLDSGADDYLVKPFMFPELLARLRVLLRRNGGTASSVISCGDLVMDTSSHAVSRNGKDIMLSAREYSILEYMMHNQGIVLERESFRSHIWSWDYDGESNVIDVYIRYLRKKIDDAANTVQKDIEEARDQQYAAEVAAQAASSSSKTSVQSAPVQSMPVQSTPVQSTPSPNAGATKLPNGKTGKDVVDYAMQFVGRVPYIWAGSTPQGWDCSGYVLYVFSKFGISLPHYSGAQAQAGYAVASIASAKPGDIIANNTHAAIYIGNGRVVNALNPGAGTVVTPVQWAFSGGYQIRRLIG